MNAPIPPSSPPPAPPPCDPHVYNLGVHKDNFLKLSSAVQGGMLSLVMCRDPKTGDQIPVLTILVDNLDPVEFGAPHLYFPIGTLLCTPDLQRMGRLLPPETLKSSWGWEWNRKNRASPNPKALPPIHRRAI